MPTPSAISILLILAVAGCAHDATPAATPSAPRVRWMLHGGGPEDDAIFRSFVEAAGRGSMVTLGAVEDTSDPDLRFWDGYFMSLGAGSAVTVNTPDRASARDEATAAALETADGVFLRGGDQSRYVDLWWQGPIGRALESAWARGAVFGGSSAGCAVLGEMVHDARETSVDPWDVLAEGGRAGQTFTAGKSFGVPGVLTDTHFTERGRLPRLAVFLAAWSAGGVGLGVDPNTALFLRDDGTGVVAGPGSVTLMRLDGGASIAGAPSLAAHLWQLPAGYELDLRATDPVLQRPSWTIQLAAAASAGPLPARTLSGDDAGAASLGRWRLEGTQAADGWRDRALSLVEGDAAVPGLLIGPQVYGSSDLAEARVGGLMWAVGSTSGMAALAIDEGVEVALSAPSTLAVAGRESLMILDGRGPRWGGASPNGWQTAAAEDVTLRLVAPGEAWDLAR